MEDPNQKIANGIEIEEISEKNSFLEKRHDRILQIYEIFDNWETNQDQQHQNKGITKVRFYILPYWEIKKFFFDLF